MDDVADALVPAEEMGQGTTELTDPPEVNGTADVPAENKMESKWLEGNKANWLKVLKENKI